MTSQIKILWVALIAVAIIALAGWFYPAVKQTIQNFGGVTNYDELDATAIKIGGASGNRIGPLFVSSCSLISPNFTVTASTSFPMDCAITGLVSGDVIDGWFATSTQVFNGWTINGSSASSTSGFATFRVYNGTGANNVIPASLASSTQYVGAHPITSAPGL